MPLVELDGKTLWPADKNRAAFKRIRSRAIARLVKEDRLRGVPESGMVCSAVQKGEGPTATVEYVVDQNLSALKHSGADAVHAWETDWAKHCLTPRDSTLFVPDDYKKPGEVTRKEPSIEDRLGGRSLADRTVAAAIAEPSPEAVAEDKPKRKRGRPRKHPL